MRSVIGAGTGARQGFPEEKIGPWQIYLRSRNRKPG
jgi:hypothetical protein